MRTSFPVASLTHLQAPAQDFGLQHSPLHRIIQSDIGSENAITIGGHRGMGENLLSTREGGRPLMRFRENTVRSFKAAAAAGASFVEFDVQVTADGVPVIWHDDYAVTMSEEAGGAPCMRHICDMTLQDFKQLLPGTLRGSSAYSRTAAIDELEQQHGRLASGAAAAASFSSKETGAVWPLARIFNREDGKRTDAALPWLVWEDDELPTLAEVFRGVDPSVGFDIEVKMATPPDLAVAPPAEVERMVAPILAAVQALATHGSRPIIFSSFDPDICRALRQRQGRFPVLLLYDGGASWHADGRAGSIAAGIAWALEAGLQGLVLDSGAAQEQRGAVALARSKGLKVLTYGLQNNDPEWVRQQHTLGVQGAIVDDVAGVVSAIGRAPDAPAVGLAQAAER